ncbi:MAG: hypothetical protein ACFFB2_01480 [Promethearchaeota archaeon]
MSNKTIERITEKLGSRMEGTTLYPGGSSVLFGWSFPFKKIGSIVIKPYYNREMTALMIHYLTWQDFIKEFQDLQIKLKGKDIRVIIPAIVGLAKIETFSRFYPILMTIEAPGKPAQMYPSVIKNIGTLARDLGQRGIICDPYPSNWKISFVNGQGIIQYIDLLSSNQLKNVHSRIAGLLKDLG